MNVREPTALVIHSWIVFAPPLFIEQLEILACQVDLPKQKDPFGDAKKNASKRLASITGIGFVRNFFSNTD